MYLDGCAALMFKYKIIYLSATTLVHCENMSEKKRNIPNELLSMHDPDNAAVVHREDPQLQSVHHVPSLQNDER